MYKNKKFLGIIPARSGSKGIIKKNIVKVNGKPLIYYTIKEALNSKYLDRLIISTDSIEIAKICEKYGVEVPFLRPKHLAGDKSKIIEAVIHVLEQLRNKGQNYDYIVLLQPTQPLRKSFHIDEAIEEIVNKKANSLVSVTKVKEHPILMRTINNNGTLECLLKVNSTVRRQDFPPYYKVNGAIYINNINHINLETSFNDNEYPYVMDKKYDLDIDEPFDLEVFKLKLKWLDKKYGC